MSLPSVVEARGRMLAALAPLGEERVTLGQAAGRTLARPVRAHRDQPPFPASAMDGWAVAASDHGRRLRIAGESAAGRGFDATLAEGQAVRIFTGAAVPEGADAVVIQEEAEREGEAAVVPACQAGQNIRRRGIDFCAGDLLLEAGERLDAWRIGLAAAAGAAELAVVRRPRMAILATGEEIVPAGSPAGPFQIFNSGTPCLAALAAGWDAEAIALPIAGDSEEAIASAARDADYDLLVTLGGASVGDHDLVKPALAKALGLTLIVDGINLRPGKPTSFGTLTGGRAVLGLPGNPASALVAAELFLRPILAALQGRSPVLPLAWAQAAQALRANGPREHWMRARLRYGPDGGLHATPFADQDSSLVTVFAQADALLRRGPSAPAVDVGEAVEILRLDRLA